jgi:small subunit ribosomal protein S17
VKRSKRFYAHDENGTAKLGDVVKIEETRPLSKLKRWQLKEIVRQAPQVAVVEAKAV